MTTSRTSDALAHTEPSRALLLGARDTLPLLPGTIPFGLIYGATALTVGMPAWLTQMMSIVVFAGSAQFAVVLLVAGGASAVVLVLTAAILNLRHVLYSGREIPARRNVEISLVDACLLESIRRAFKNLHNPS